MITTIREDVYRMVGQDGGPALRMWIRAFVFSNTRAVMGYRLAHWLAIHHLLPIAYVIRQRILNTTGADINPRAIIGPGLELVHTSGVVIGGDVIIGRTAWIAQGVTIGCGSIPGQPVIGDRVQIGAGAKVLGGITVGHQAVIGANAVVTRDVPDYGIVTIASSSMRGRKDGGAQARG